MSILTALALQAADQERETIYLVLGLAAVALIMWGLFKRLVVLVVLAGIIAAGAWYLYLS